MEFLISAAHAQAAPGAQAPSMMSPLIMMVLFFAIFWFIAIRPQMKRAKEHRAMLGALGKGDEVVVAGGGIGRVAKMGESMINVEVANGVELQVQRAAVVQVLPKGTFGK